ncbi:hypothetical protein RT952_000592 [Staphylococcus pseudintermedius]|uniref:hypothetical protein n=1 Tax=Staphylococcus pseudintermedius TaxID=283734 RepID=UPI0011225B83|nr:hypothetical protein [Staphylococcus pseudintermedius]EGQ1748650.1 hypothetical protein [Staphylococcus pseudintermedius]EGQ4060186.1 hypothetical protein [Staphylococcus pseudintermedius]EJA1920699.1 hypothetical protein [Staphylococcus pseudintermedius]ELJ9052810.1 hypothetical protein [Staphylococcus pseudintermedius]ELJ9055146.1 hypothetical protein [Staphylococcus pseudintermedius]
MNALGLMLISLTVLFLLIMILFPEDRFYFRKYPKTIVLNELEVIEHYDLITLYMKDGKNFTLHLNDYKKQYNSDSDFITLDIGLIARKDGFVLFDMYGVGRVKCKGKELSYIKNSNGEFTSLSVENKRMFKKLKYKIRDGVAYKC